MSLSMSTAPTSKAASTSVPLVVGVPTGAASGAISALTGMGGGVFIIPVLRHLTPMTQQVCNATSMLAVTVSGAVATISYGMELVPNFPIAVLLCSTSMFTATIGVTVASKISNKGLTKLMGVILVLMSAFIVLQPASNDTAPTVSAQPEDVPCDLVPVWLMNFYNEYLPEKASQVVIADTNEALRTPWMFVGTGLFTGFLSGMLGVGGGILLTSCLALATDMEQKRVIATSLATMLPVGLSATMMNARHGNVSIRAGAIIGGCSAVTVWFTSRIVKDDKVSNQTLRHTFAALMAVSAATLLWKV
eukprot:CFRG3298T1